MTAAPSQESVFEAARAGDPRAQRALIAELEGPLLAIARRIVGDPATAEDVFIQAVTKLLRKLGDLEEPAALKAYARRIVCTVALDVLQSKGERDSRRAMRDTQAMGSAVSGSHGVVHRLSADEPDVEGRLIRTEGEARVRAELARIGEPSQTYLRLHYEEGLTFDQIAEVTGVSRRTVFRRVGEARVTLAARLKGLEEFVQ